MSNRRRLITLIHIAKSNLSLDDDAYRDSLEGVTGKTSCSKMTIPELEKALEHFKSCGFKPTAKRKYSPKTVVKDRRSKIRAMWITMYNDGVIRDGSEKALSSWIERMTAKANNDIGYKTLQFVPDDTLNGLIEQLKRWYKRA